ncbi:unnamed protein product [Chrysoparadoxa australica]
MATTHATTAQWGWTVAAVVAMLSLTLRGRIDVLAWATGFDFWLALVGLLLWGVYVARSARRAQGGNPLLRWVGGLVFFTCLAIILPFNKHDVVHETVALSREECNAFISAANNMPSEQGTAVTPLSAVANADVRELWNDVWSNRVAPFLAERYEGIPSLSDVNIVSQRSAGDDSIFDGTRIYRGDLRVIAMLSEASSFGGGGIQLPGMEQKLSLYQGSVAMVPAKLKHGFAQVTTGEMYVATGTVRFTGRDWKESLKLKWRLFGLQHSITGSRFGYSKSPNAYYKLVHQYILHWLDKS